jgi:hypothetical protein
MTFVRKAAERVDGWRGSRVYARRRVGGYQRDTIVPWFLCKTTASGRKVFMLQYRTNSGERRKPKVGLFGAHR